MTPVISLRGLTKHFGRVVAMENVDLELNTGDVVGLIGQNGSGKSTLLKTLGGLHQPDSGVMTVHGRKVQLRSAVDAARHGIGLVHQEQSLIPNLTVAENIFLDKPNPASRGGFYSWSTMFEAARRQLDKIEVDISPAALVEELSHADRQMVELAKVLAIEETVTDRMVILFDEPTAILSPSEIQILFRQIRRLRSRAAIVFVSHRTDEVLEICDRVVVMTHGRKVAERPTAGTRREELYHLLVGHARTDTAISGDSQRERTKGPARLKCDQLTLPNHFKDVSLEVHEGEIVGLAGVIGSGAEEFCRALFGAEQNVSGKILLDGEQIAPRSPSAAVALGLGYVPSDRKGEGALRGRTILQNMVLTFGLEFGKFGVIVDRRREEDAAIAWLNRLKVVASSPDARIESLSGGNQQKAVLGKWLMSEKLRVLLLDHPTRGLDPGARDDLYEAIREVARAGLPVIFVGDTVEEILEIAHTILVMRDGEVTARFDLINQERPSEEMVVAAMV